MMVRRIARGLLWFVGLALAIVLAAVSAVVLYARTDGGRARVRALALAQARQVLPGLDIGRVGGDYIHDLVLEDVSVLDRAGQRAIHVDRLAVTFDLPSLVRRTVHVRELRLERPVVLGRADEDGVLNLARLTAPPSGPAPAEKPPPADDDGGGARWRVRADRVIVVDGAADVAPADGERTRVSALALDAGGDFDGGRVTVVVRALDGRVQRGAVDARIDLAGTAGLVPGPDGGTTLGTYDVTVRAGGRLGDDRLSLALTARGRGVPTTPASGATVDLEAPPMRLGGVSIGRVRLRAISDGESWRLPRTTLRAAGARFELEARGIAARQVEVTASASARKLVSRAVRVGAATLKARLVARRPNPGAALGDTQVTLRLDGSVSDVRAGDRTVGTAQVTASANGPLRAPRGTLRVAARAVSAGAGAPRIDSLALTAASDGRGLRVQGAASGPRLAAGVTVRGTLGGRATRVTVERASVAFETGRYKQALALVRPFTVEYRARDRIELGMAEVRGTGRLLTGRVAAGGIYRLRARRQQPLVEARVTLGHASFGGFDPIDADLRATLGARQATADLEAHLGGARLRLQAALPVVTPRRGPPRLATRGPVDIRLETQTIRLQALPILQRKLASLGLSGGTVDAAIAIQGDIAQPQGTAAFDLRDAMFRNVTGLAHESTLRTLPGVGASLRLETRPGAVGVTGTFLLRRTGVLAVSGESRVELGALIGGGADALAQAPWHATVDIPKFELASLADVVDAMKRVHGTLAGRIEIGGTPRRPSGRGDITVTGARVDDVALSKVLVHGEAVEGRVDAAVNLARAGGGDLYAQARIRRDQGDALDAHLGARGIDIAFLRPFLPGVREVAGTLVASARATGTLSAPVVSGAAKLTGGRLGIIGQPTFHDVELEAELAPGRLDILALSMRSGEGGVNARGVVILKGLEPQSLSLGVSAREFLVAAGPGSGARLDGELSFEAARRDAVISGKARVPRAVVWLPKLSAGGGGNLQPTRPREDIRFVDAAALAAEERRLAEANDVERKPTRIDLRAQAGPVYVRSKDLDLELESRLHLATVGQGADARLALTGVVRVRRGRMTIQGQRFDFDKADLSFDGGPRPNPALDIRLTRQYPEAIVVIEIRGKLDKPELRLSSDPPVFDEAQVLSLILTGQTGGHPSAGGKPFDAKGAVSTMVLGKLADKLAPEIGLDVMRVENVQQKTAEGVATGDTDMRVEVGKYISDRIYLSYAHVFGAPESANTNEAHVEYRMTRYWVLESIFGDAGVGSVDALWTYRY